MDLSSKAAQDHFSREGGLTLMKNRSFSEETSKGGQIVETSCPPKCALNTGGCRAVSGMCQVTLDGLGYLRNNIYAKFLQITAHNYFNEILVLSDIQTERCFFFSE